MKYTLLNEVVTVYLLLDGVVVRRVLDGARLEQGRRFGAGGTAESDMLLLVRAGAGGYDYVPAHAFAALGDDAKAAAFTLAKNCKVLLGEGPELCPADWAGLVPGLRDGVGIVGCVREVYNRDGQLCHLEAEGK